MNEPVIETMKISDVRSNLNTLVNEVYRHEKRVIVEKSGIPVAVMISLSDFEQFDFLEKKRAERFKIVDEIRASFAGISSEELEREGIKAVEAVRAKKREAHERLIAEVREAFADVPPEEIERMAEQTLAEARAELRDERPKPRTEVRV